MPAPTVRIIPAGTIGADSVASAVDLAEWYDEVGAEFTIAYCEPSTNARYGEDIDADEVAWHANTGRGIWLNWEETKLDALEGAAYGRRVGMFLRTMALDLAYPVECPLIFSVDFPISDPADIETAIETLDAFRQTIAPWPLGVYGPTPIFLAMRDRGWTYYGWRAAAESWGPPVTGTFHVQQHPPERDGTVDRNTVVAPIPMWFPPEPVWPPLFPSGYGTALHTAAEIGWRMRADLAIPHWWDRYENLMRSRNGRLGIGSAIRSRSGQQPSEASRTGRSFHFIHTYADGSSGHAAIDAVALNPGGNHTVPPAGLIPRQTDDEAALFGVHLNVDRPSGGTSSHLVHAQPRELDGFGAWEAAGRPPIMADWPYPDHMPKPPDPQLPGTDPESPEAIMSDIALYQVPGSGIFGWPSNKPVPSKALADRLIDAGMPFEIIEDPDDVWAAMGAVLAPGNLDPAARDMMRQRYNDSTDRIDLDAPELPPVAELEVNFPDELTVRVAEMPDQRGSLSVKIDG